jgi:HD-like signal output (HDOD) protein
MNAQDYANNACDIFVLPEAVVKIKQLIDDDAASMEEIAQVINYDPAIMTQILKISNSALYKFPSKITTVSKAIQVIGTNAVYDLVLAYGVANAFKDMPTNIVDLDRFWEQAISCSLLAKFLAEELSIKEPEKFFVCGLLHNLGELVVVRINPQVSEQCTEVSEENSPLSLQLKHLGFSYAEVGGRLLRLWGLPEGIYKPIFKQHASVYKAETIEEQIVQLSVALALNNVYKDVYAKHDNISPQLYEPLGLDLESLDNALDFTNLQLMSAIALFSPSSFALY